jgi:hypothetical protein
VGIIKNVFLAGRMGNKGFAHGELTVTWTVLVHIFSASSYFWDWISAVPAGLG